MLLIFENMNKFKIYLKVEKSIKKNLGNHIKIEHNICDQENS